MHIMKRITMIALLVMLVALSVSPTGVRAADNFVAALSGADEAPVPRDTNARGLATVKWNRDATAFDFTLIAANIENVTAAHIHCGAAGVAGPVGVTLLHNMPAGGGRFDGVLSSGTITAPDAGNSCGWLTLTDVFSAMNAGNTYVNVHTNDGAAPTNTGPGDFPGGEIRGQLH
jgi:hypothetical protein